MPLHWALVPAPDHTVLVPGSVPSLFAPAFAVQPQSAKELLPALCHKLPALFHIPSGQMHIPLRRRSIPALHPQAAAQHRQWNRSIPV